MAIWFRHLLTDSVAIRKKEFRDRPFILVAPERNRIVVMAANALAEARGVRSGMAAADAKAISDNLQVLEYTSGQDSRLLKYIGLWCIRYTPLVAIDPPDGLMLNISGCAHLWGGEKEYYKDIIFKLKALGYDARAAIADTPGAAWAIARYARHTPIIDPAKQAEAIMLLPPSALRLEASVLDKLYKLGLREIKSFIAMPRPVLRRRFGEVLLKRLSQALGTTDEYLIPLVPPVPYIERLPCLEAVRTAKAIELAIETLLNALCLRMRAEGKGVREAVLKCFRVDGIVVKAKISTSRGSHSVAHLSSLFSLQISKISPALGIELFLLEALKVEDIDQVQEQLWARKPGLEDAALAELLDRIAGKIGSNRIMRYLPAEHYWPERSVKPALSLQEKPATNWRTDRPRPIRLLGKPEPVEVMALLPDYPPKVFTYKGKRHVVEKADGPERIEREWWLDKGEHRDYYMVEDEDGHRYWIFRSGHYDSENGTWYLHGYFA